MKFLVVNSEISSALSQMGRRELDGSSYTQAKQGIELNCLAPSNLTVALSLTNQLEEEEEEEEEEKPFLHLPRSPLCQPFFLSLSPSSC